MKVLYDFAALIARIGLGVIFVAHGWMKLAGGLEATTAMFVQMSIPYPEVSAAVTMVVEVGGGGLLALGLFTPVAGLALAIVMAGAFALVHLPNGIFVQDNGFELVVALGCAALLLAAAGAGRISLDHLIFGRRRKRLKELKESGATESESEVPWQAGDIRSTAAETQRERDTPPTDLA